MTYPLPSLTVRQTWGWSVVGLAAFHLAYFFAPLGILILLYLVAMAMLPRVPSTRWAFYLGFGLGYAIAAPHLWFMTVSFSAGAVALWGVLALWFAFYLLLGRMILDRWAGFGVWLLPFLWFSLEYFRSELYPLRFSWLIPGFALSHSAWLPLTGLGVYAVGLVGMLLITGFQYGGLKTRIVIGGLSLVLVVCVPFFRSSASEDSGPIVVGIQMESPRESAVLSNLESARQKHPDADIFLLSEYTFEKEIREEIAAWCGQHETYLIAGGRQEVPEKQDFYNTVFVVGPTGEVVFRQAKTQPIPFFDDGLPAPSQEVWESPWGRVGIAICYDVSYTRVMDPVIQKGAEALFVPAVDVITWGAWEHKLHAKIIPVRAREYGVPLFRLGSSGISIFADRNGHVLARGEYPGHGDILKARLEFSSGRLPLDRYLAWPIVIGMGAIILVVLMPRRSPIGSKSSID